MGGGVVLTAMAQAGIPVSTTHAISSAIMGVGAARRLTAVHWGVGQRIIAAWIITIPASAFCSFVAYQIMGEGINVAHLALSVAILAAVVGVAWFKQFRQGELWTQVWQGIGDG